MSIDELLDSADWDLAAQGCELLLSHDPSAYLAECRVSPAGDLALGPRLAERPHAHRIAWYLAAHAGRLQQSRLVADKSLLELPSLLAMAPNLRRLLLSGEVQAPLSEAFLSALPPALALLDARNLRGAHASGVPRMVEALPPGCELIVSDALYWEAPALRKRHQETHRGLRVEPFSLPTDWVGDRRGTDADLTLSLRPDGTFRLSSVEITLSWFELHQRQTGTYRLDRVERVLVLSPATLESLRGPRCQNTDCPNQRWLHTTRGRPCPHHHCREEAPGWVVEPEELDEAVLRLSWDGAFRAVGRDLSLGA